MPPTDATVDASHPTVPSLMDRIPGQSVLEELARVQAPCPPRSRAARFWGRSPLAEDAAPWYSGARGERHVGRLLAALDESWTVLHAVLVGKGTSDIDHVVIGPGGVFTINTKNHPGKTGWVAGTTFMVSGQRQPYLRSSDHEAKRATKLLSGVLPLGLEAIAVLAIVEPKTLTIRERPKSTVVLDARRLVKWLRRRRRILDAALVVALIIGMPLVVRLVLGALL